jgi:hypothetical protein
VRTGGEFGQQQIPPAHLRAGLGLILTDAVNLEGDIGMQLPSRRTIRAGELDGTSPAG